MSSNQGYEGDDVANLDEVHGGEEAEAAALRGFRSSSSKDVIDLTMDLTDDEVKAMQLSNEEEEISHMHRLRDQLQRYLFFFSLVFCFFSLLIVSIGIPSIKVKLFQGL